ncbi:MAG: division plane positioning ATPase MipZ [Novosphingobium sp.]
MEPVPDPRLVAAVVARIDAALAASDALLVVGICGAQGSGKSTLAAHLAERLGNRGLRVAALSLDDLYRTRAERMRLAAQIHPLLATRGVPGTHDVALGLATLDALARGEPARLPRFDKAADDRAPAQAWPLAPAETQILLLEGWCLGARPQADVCDPVNAFEAAEDPDAVWRNHANSALAGEYQQLFARIDLLVLLAAPGWDIVARWREQQEAELRTGGGARVMNPAEVTRFIQLYERLTRWILEEMPARADLIVQLGENREVLNL